MSVERLRTFFDAFADRDGETMASCYHPEAAFRDPVFGRLDGARIGDMWRMLTSSASELRIAAFDMVSDGPTGSARWVADYPFGATGRPVHNEVRSRFEFRDGLIIRQQDSFSFPRWARQALGPTAIPMAWIPLYRKRVSAIANAQLDRFAQGA